MSYAVRESLVERSWLSEYGIYLASMLASYGLFIWSEPLHELPEYAFQCCALLVYGYCFIARFISRLELSAEHIDKMNVMLKDLPAESQAVADAISRGVVLRKRHLDSVSGAHESYLIEKKCKDIVLSKAR
jgi:hypothetical protein